MIVIAVELNTIETAPTTESQYGGFWNTINSRMNVKITVFVCNKVTVYVFNILKENTTRALFKKPKKPCAISTILS